MGESAENQGFSRIHRLEFPSPRPSPAGRGRKSSPRRELEERVIPASWSTRRRRAALELLREVQDDVHLFHQGFLVTPDHKRTFTYPCAFINDMGLPVPTT